MLQTRSNVPVNDLRIAADERECLLERIRAVLERGWFVLGPEVKGFEAEFASYCGVPHAVSVANGTEALELALRAAGVKAGDRVLTVANAGFYSTTAILAIGATPVFVDIDPQRLTISAEGLARALRPGIKAVIVTHLYGQLADMVRILDLARRVGVTVVEDCAQAHGAQAGGIRAGAFGDLGCFSFYPTKNLGALGDGGAVVTAREDFAATLRALRQYGWSEAKYHVALTGGCNSRLDELQAAVLRERLARLDEHNRLRRAIAARYNHAFRELPLKCPATGEDYVAHLYVVRCAKRDALRAHLAARGVAAEVHYPVPDHHQPAVRERWADVVLPVTEATVGTLLTLPCFPAMTEEQSSTVERAVLDFYA